MNDCGANAFVASHAKADVAAEIVELILDCPLRLMWDGTVSGYEPYEDRLATPGPRSPRAPTPGRDGALLLGHDGPTEGHQATAVGRRRRAGLRLNPLLSGLFGMDAEHLPLPRTALPQRPAGLDHRRSPWAALPWSWSASTRQALELIERHRISHSQWVPTMFVRMLKLPQADRTRYDLGSHKMAVHAAAPCPVEVKRQMIDWWGPILAEYYAGTEFNGFTYDSKDWLAHPGSVGRPLVGVIHICDDEGGPVPTGEPGTIYFEREEQAFEYHNDPEKTRSAQHPPTRCGPRWATSATSTRRASSTSPTARRT